MEKKYEAWALACLGAFYELLGERRELWESGAEFINMNDLRFGQACYLLGMAHQYLYLADHFLKLANSTTRAYRMEIEWRRHEGTGALIVNDTTWEMEPQ